MDRNTFFAAALLLLAPSIAAAETVSVSARRANVRSGPGGAVLWEAYRFTPFKVTARQGSWVEIEDFEGDAGWVHKSVLGRTPAVIVNTVKANLRDAAGAGGKVLWVLDKGYPLRVLKKQGGWYNVTDDGDAAGWIHASTVWGCSEEDGDGEKASQGQGRAPAAAVKKSGRAQNAGSAEPEEKAAPGGQDQAAGEQAGGAGQEEAPPEEGGEN